MISLKQRKQQGFTIVELLIVIVVIGILAGLVITTYNGIQQKARNTERTTDLKTFQSQLEAYYANVGSYPGTDVPGGLGGSNTSVANVNFIKTNMKGMDVETLRDPKGNPDNYSLGTTATATEYAYVATNDAGATTCTTAGGDCTKYTLTAKQEGSATDITVASLN